MTNDEKLMQQALEALDSPILADEHEQRMKLRRVADALRDRLAPPSSDLDEMTARRKLTPHQRIMRAFRLGIGLRLSADEVKHLAKDHAIIRCAQNDDEGYDEAETHKELPK